MINNWLKANIRVFNKQDGPKIESGSKKRLKAMFGVVRVVAKSAARAIKVAKMWAKTGSIA